MIENDHLGLPGASKLPMKPLQNSEVQPSAPDGRQWLMLWVLGGGHVELKAGSRDIACSL